MHRTLSIISPLAALVVASGAMGCGSPSAPPPPACDTTKPVSFSSDVIPVFERGCTLSNVCHGQMNNSAEEDNYLGLNQGDGGIPDEQAVYKGLVGVTAKEDPSMKLVTPGSTDTSYLWQKVAVIGVQGQTLPASLASACKMAPSPQCTDCSSNTPCGGEMPYLGEQLNSADTCTLQSWILQGAKNN
jgi:hypothetical protein